MVRFPFGKDGWIGSDAVSNLSTELPRKLIVTFWLLVNARHLGFHNESYMPTGRGFDSFFGYLSGMQDHFTQELGAMIGCKQVVDLTDGAQPAHSKNGTYSGWLYNAEAVAVVNTAPEPFFLNYWLQNTHAPFEVPTQYSDLYKFPGNEELEVFNGMVSVVDSAVGNVTAALKKRPGTWMNTLLIYTHDNGAPLGGGGSNFPVSGLPAPARCCSVTSADYKRSSVGSMEVCVLIGTSLHGLLAYWLLICPCDHECSFAEAKTQILKEELVSLQSLPVGRCRRADVASNYRR